MEDLRQQELSLCQRWIPRDLLWNLPGCLYYLPGDDYTISKPIHPSIPNCCLKCDFNAFSANLGGSLLCQHLQPCWRCYSFEGTGEESSPFSVPKTKSAFSKSMVLFFWPNFNSILKRLVQADAIVAAGADAGTAAEPWSWPNNGPPCPGCINMAGR